MSASLHRPTSPVMPASRPWMNSPNAGMDHQAFNVPPMMARPRSSDGGNASGAGEKLQLTETLYYPDSYITKPPIAGELDRDRLLTTYALGFPVLQRGAFCLASSTFVLYPIGNSVMLLNTVNMEQKILPGLRCGGICALAVHPARTFIAVAERHDNGPNIYIYSFPDIRLFRVLRGGAEQSFSTLCFSQADSGATLASVAGDPDYTLTVWDWQQERVVLRAKAFGQDVQTVAFSPTNPLALVTSGVGHIKFWKMASTFTGLKLQGMLGKFGATELTDIPCFVFLPSGKVLSGTESGNLLLWDGNFIQCEIAGTNDANCHAGAVEYIAIEDGEIVTAGEDGYIRTWDLEAIEGPEQGAENKAPTATVVYELEPIDEFLVGRDVRIKSVLKLGVSRANLGSAGSSSASATASVPSSQEYLVADWHGAMWRVDIRQHTAERQFTFHRGAVVALDACTTPVHHLMASVGADMTLRITDPLSRSNLAIARAPVPGTCVKYLPRALDSIGCSLVVGFADGSVRFYRHAVPTPGKASIAMTRTHAVRPHSSPIVNIAFSSDATVMITAAENGGIFVFLVRVTGVTFDRNTHLVPVGFFSLGRNVQSLTWAMDLNTKSTSNRIRGRLLVVDESGQIVSVTINLDKSYERDHNFAIPAADFEIVPWSLQKYIETVVMPATQLDPQHAPGDGAAAASDAAKKDGAPSTNKPGSASAAKERPGSPSASNGGDKSEGEGAGDGTAPKEGGAAAADAPPPLTFKVSKVMYIEQDHFLAAIECSNGMTEVRSCLLTDGKLSRLLLSLRNAVEITSLSLASSGKLALVGCSDGTVYYRPVSFDGDLSLSNSGGHETAVYMDEHFWRAHLHAGPVTSVRGTFDDAIIVSSGRDGAQFVLKSTSDDLVQRALNTEGMILPPLDSDADDLPNKYTIQEAKMMLRIDEENALAEQRKQVRLATLRELQREFSQIVQENKSLPKELQLPSEAFQIDEGLCERMKLATEAKVAKAKNQLLWNSERIALLLHKLKKRFNDSVLTPTITVKGLKSATIVHSFRTENITTFESSERSSEQLTASEASKSAGASTQDVAEQAPGGASTEKALPDSSAATALSPAPTATTAVATGTAAVVAQEQTTGPSRKDKPAAAAAAQVADQASRLEDRRRVKAERLEMWKELMTEKPNATSEDPRDTAAIRFAETHMGDYKLKRDKNYIVPENERVNAEMKHKQIAMLQTSLIRIMEAFNDKVRALEKHRAQISQQLQQANVEITALEAGLQYIGHEEAQSRQLVLPGLAKLDASAAIKQIKHALELEIGVGDVQEHEMLAYRLRHNLQRMQLRARAITDRFDNSIDMLCQERLSVATDVKAAEIRLMLLYKEWKLLKEFEKHDTILNDKLSQKLSEKAAIDVKIGAIQSKLAEKRVEIEQAVETRKGIESKLSEAIGESSKFEEILGKIFRRRVKRKRRKEALAADGPGSNGEDANGDEEEEEEESDDDEEEDEDEDELVSDDCPAGCDEAMHQAVLDLRERRLDLEESLADVQKGVEALKKDLDIFSKKERVIASALKQTEQEIQEFQSQKQQKLNELDVVVPLSLHQIQFLEDSMESALVFPDDGLAKLRHRILETEEETEQVRKDHKQLKNEHVTLLAVRKEKRNKLRDAEGKCTEVQMLKFGRTVDLDRLEKLASNKTADDLRQQIAEKERRHAAELEQWDKSIAEMKRKLTTAVVENTRHLEQIYELTERRKALEMALDAKQQSVTTEYNGPAKKDMAEQARLLQTVQRQAQEIEALRMELAGLLRKPSGIVPPIPATRKAPPVVILPMTAESSDNPREALQVTSAGNDK